MHKTNWKVNRWLLTATLVAGLAGAACAEPVESPDSPADGAHPESTASPTLGKGDAPTDGRLIDILEIINRENVEGESETLRLFAEVNADHYDEMEQGAQLTATLSAAEMSDFSIQATLTYEAEGAGAFVSDSIDTSDLLPYQALRVTLTGEHDGGEVTQTFDFLDGAETGTELLEDDPFADAYDVSLPVIWLDPAAEVPSYRSADTDGTFGLGGTEFWQKWEGGHNPTYSYSAGTEAGRKCMFASARRFEAIMADPPPALVALKEESNWSGRFFNWNDDYSHEEARGSARGAVLWAWRTGLIKWISQTGKDGACYLPTYDVVESAADNCLATAARDDGEIEGCQGY